MSKLIFSFFALLIYCSPVMAQSKRTFPSFAEMKLLTTIKTNDKFKIKAKQMGFNFEKKEVTTNRTEYIYVRKSKVATSIYTDRLFYYMNESWAFPIIAITAVKDLEQLYLPFINKEFNSVACEGDTDANVLQTCYENKTYHARLIDVRMEFDDGSQGNSFTLRLYKKE